MKYPPGRIASFLTACCLMAAACAAQGRTWPTQPLYIVVPFPAGGAGDIVPRIIGSRLSEILHQAVIVENKPGAQGAIGINVVAKAKPDGYTLGVASSGPVVIGKRLFPNLPYDPKKDLVPVVLTYQTPFLLVVPAASPIKNLQELFGAARSRPGKLNMAIPNLGSVQHLLSEQMKSVAHVDITDIPYNGGGPAATAAASGEVDMTWAALPNVLGFIKSGKLRAIAISSGRRDSNVPDVPTVGEQGWPALLALNWNGLVAPAGTPVDILDKLNKEVDAIMAEPAIAKRFAGLGVSALGGTRLQFSELMQKEDLKWAQVIETAHIQPQ